MSDLLSPTTAARFNIETITLRKIQALSGGLFFIFLLLHISNTLVAPMGHEFYNDYQRLLRKFYNNPVVEVMLVFFPLLAHTAAGVMLYTRRRRTRRVSLATRLHTWAGFFLLTVIFGHIAATRGLGVFMNAAPSFEGVSFSLWWMPMIFYPYYFLLFLAGLYHATNGLSMVSGRLGVSVGPMSIELKTAIMVIGSVWCLVSLLAFGGHLQSIPDPTDNAYARAYGSIFGIELMPMEK